MKTTILKASMSTHMAIASLKIALSFYKKLAALAILSMVSGAVFAEVDTNSAQAASNTFCTIWGVIIPWKVPAALLALGLFVLCYVPIVKNILTAKVDESAYILAAVIIFSSEYILEFFDDKFGWEIFSACTAGI